VQVVATPMIAWTPCTVQARTQSPIPAAPPGNFSQPAKPPGSFSELKTKMNNERDELLDQQRMLQEQRRRLLSAYAGVSSRVPATPEKPFGVWNHSGEQSHSSAHPQISTEMKPHGRTTVTLRDLPEGFSRDAVADFLISQGFEKKFDFIYTPVKFSVMATIGYAFVNFVSYEAANECVSNLDGFKDWATPSEKVLSVLFSEKDQGLATIIDRHRNSPVMHPSVHDEYKPALYVDGVRAEFPPPTKHLKAPRMQRYTKDVEEEP